jgi:tetratricopeptide (TPR) repeat protein
LSLAGIEVSLKRTDEPIRDLDPNINYIVVPSPESSDEFKLQAQDQHVVQREKNLLLFFDSPPAESPEYYWVSSEKDYFGTVFCVLRYFYPDCMSEDDVEAFQKRENPAVSTCANEGRAKMNGRRVLASVVAVVLLVALGRFCLLTISPALKIEIPMTLHLLPRKNLSQQVSAVFARQKYVKVVAIVGPGGSGKTTFARSFAQSAKPQVLFEINAETELSIRNSISKLAALLARNTKLKSELQLIQAVPDEQEQTRQKTAFIRAQLKEIGSWFLIFDNVGTFQDIQEFFPSDSKLWGTGRVIITTRNENIQAVSQITNARTVNVGELSEDEKLQLFCKISGPQVSKGIDDIKQFLMNLPSLPLDVSAAAHYVRDTQTSLDDYLAMTRKSEPEFESRQTLILSEDVGYDKTRYSIISSNFQQILHGHPEFKKLLFLVCLLDSQDIPRAFLYNCDQDRFAVDEFFYRLKQHSLILERDDTFSIHRNTQAIALNFMLSQMNDAEKEKLLESVVAILTPFEQLCGMLYKVDSTLDGEYLSSLLRHLKAMLTKIPQLSATPAKHRARICTAIGHILQWQKLASSMVFYKQVVDEGNPEELLSPRDLAVMYINLGSDFVEDCDYEQAELYIKKSMQLVATLDDADAIECLCWYQLGHINEHKGNVDECKKYLRKALTFVEGRQEGYATQLLARIYLCLFGLHVEHYMNKPEVEEGMPYFKKMLDLFHADPPYHISRHPLPKQFPSTVFTARTVLSLHYARCGFFKKSLEEMKEMEFIRNYYKGSLFDVLTLAVLRERSHCMTWLGRPEQARKDLEFILDTYKRVGLRWRGTWVTKDLIEAQIKSNKLEGAYENCRHFIDSGFDVDGNNICLLASDIVRYHAAVIKFRQNDFSGALECFREFFKHVEIFCKGFLEKGSYEDLARADSFDVADDVSVCFERSLAIFTAILGTEHPFVRDYVTRKGYPDSWWWKLKKRLTPIAWQAL